MKNRVSFKARRIVGGHTVRGQVVFSREPIAFLQGVDSEKGIVKDPKSDIYNLPFSEKILVFPHGVGSSVGAYVIYSLKRSRKAPKAIINQISDITTASGCAIAGIPLIDVGNNNAMKALERAKRVSVDTKKERVTILDWSQ